MADGAGGELAGLLAAERDALRCGDFAVLETQAAQKAELFQRLAHHGAPPETLRRIKMMVTENQALLSAAIGGVRAARDRLDALQKVRDGLTVYDQSGQSAKVATAPPALRKKA